MKKNKPNIGIIGAGMVADLHMGGIARTRCMNVLWFADPDKKTLAAKMKKYRLPHGSSDYRDVLKDKHVDAVLIASPPFTHYEIAVASMRAGKDILLEKPMVANRAQMNKLVKEVRKHRKLNIVECSCRHTRLQPKFSFIKKMIDNGDIGKVYHIHHNHLMRRTFIEYNPAGVWSLNKSLAGAGPLFDWGVYDLSFHLGLLGDIPKLVRMKSFCKNGIKVFRNPKIKQNVEEHAGAFMEFDTGLTYYYERGAGVHCEIDNETRIFGTRGSLIFSYCSWDSPEVEHFWVNKNRVEKRTIRKVDMSKHFDDHTSMVNHFGDCLTGKAKPAMTVPLAAKHLDILFRIVQSQGAA